jgi:2-polyprenyl-6-methoxyphenol hydroxylase-like FAD-dependent oxidoreductase
MAATWMAQTGIKTLVIERKPSHTKAGHADGLESRTLEILDSFGIGAAIWAEANRTIEVCLWVTHTPLQFSQKGLATDKQIIGPARRPNPQEQRLDQSQ